MSDLVRRAGTFVDADGSTVTWSVADGRRGRRWRWVVAGTGSALGVAHTVETGPDGAFARLESATPEALLTLHREADGSLHGNRTGRGGVEHLRFDASAPRFVLVGHGAPGLAILAAGLPALAEASTLDLLTVSDGLAVAAGEGRIAPIGRATLRLELAGRGYEIEVGAGGLPAIAVASTSWPLEER
ncbi:MAG: hypothetical protein HYX57_01920 [Chloroflexi bacterium]|nr:hypothetical protein [Chloroflexota bacterium]